MSIYQLSRNHERSNSSRSRFHLVQWVPHLAQRQDGLFLSCCYDGKGASPADVSSYSRGPWPCGIRSGFCHLGARWAKRGYKFRIVSPYLARVVQKHRSNVRIENFLNRPRRRHTSSSPLSLLTFLVSLTHRAHKRRRRRTQAEAPSSTPTIDESIRNIAIIAHVDHGKTTLVGECIPLTLFSPKLALNPTHPLRRRHAPAVLRVS